MNKTDFNFANTNNSSGNQKFNKNFDGFEGIWQTFDDVSSVSFELLLPSKNIVNKKDQLPNHFLSHEELIMRQNLVDLAIKENATVRENKNNSYVDILVKKDKDIFTQRFAGHIKDMTEDDMEFFKLVLNNPNVAINNSDSIVVEDEKGKKTLKKLDFSKSMMNLIEYAYGSNRPIRLDFAQNLSIILKIDKQGQVSAEFVSSDKAMGYLLKTNLPLLRQKLDSEGIKYKKIFYRDEEKE